MWKNIFSYLLIAIIAYTLGTASILNAEEGKKDDAEIKQLSAKLDQVLENQKEMQAMLKKIWTKL